jgi:hypothetical protein
MNAVTRILLICCALALGWLAGGPLAAREPPPPGKAPKEGRIVNKKEPADRLVNQERPANGFTTIALIGGGTVKIRQTGKEAVTVRAPRGLVDLATAEVADDTLTLTGPPGSDAAEFTVEVKDLRGLVLTGAGRMEAKTLKVKRLTVTISGSGQVSASGKADALQLTVTGSGDFRGSDLKTDRTSIEHTGIGKAVVNVKRQLDVSIRGIGSVEYIGSPKVRPEVLGLGSVTRRRSPAPKRGDRQD